MITLPKLKFLYILAMLLVLTSCSYFDRIKVEERQVPWPTEDRRSNLNLRLYFPTMYDDKERIGQEDRLVPILEVMANTVVQQLLLGPYRQGNLTFIFPRDTKILNVDVQDSIAYINFNQNVFEDTTQGINDETIAYCLVYSLTEIEGIDRVQILVKGQSIETKVDGFDLTKPLSREDVAKP